MTPVKSVLEAQKSNLPIKVAIAVNHKDQDVRSTKEISGFVVHDFIAGYFLHF